jgi:hypothetical protein
MTTLKPCPCGEVPSELVLYVNHAESYMDVNGDCCTQWQVTACIGSPSSAEERMLLAIERWNAAPRGEGA